MTIAVLKDGSYYGYSNRDVLFNVETQEEVIRLMHYWLNIPLEEIELGMKSILDNGHNVLEYGDMKGTFIYSKYVPTLGDN